MIDGNEFVIERLFDGSIIGWQQIILQENSFIFARAVSNVKMLILPF